MLPWLLLWIVIAVLVVAVDVLAVSIRHLVLAAGRVSAHIDRIGTPPVIEPHRVGRLSLRFAALAEHYALVDVRCRKAAIGVSAAVAACRGALAGGRRRL